MNGAATYISITSIDRGDYSDGIYYLKTVPLKRVFQSKALLER